MKPLFEAIAPNGHAFRVYVDGRTEGFPPDCIVVNRFKAHVGLLIETARGKDVVPFSIRGAVEDARQ